MNTNKKPHMTRRLYVAVTILFCCCAGEKNPVAPDLESPTARITHPIENATLSNSTERIAVVANDNLRVTRVDFFVNGQLINSHKSSPWGFQWRTDSFPEGNYELSIIVHDRAGNVATDAVMIKLQDLVTITEIKVSREVDTNKGRLEIEAHMFEFGSNRFLGCCGKHSGLEHVDQKDVLYTVRGYFQKPPDGVELLTFDEVKDKTIFIQVIEDDRDECPISTVLEPVGQDDLVGESPAFSGQTLLTPQTKRFDDVAHFKITKGRKRGQ